jgi:predicted heme/steroid binding protein
MSASPSKYGPARYDDTWAKIGEDTGFYSSGKSYYQVLWTAPQGNAYYILAHQYIAARLNILNGASTTPEVDAAMLWAETQFFNLYSPGNALSKSVKNQATTYATLLNSYNTGAVGPGHCSE